MKLVLSIVVNFLSVGLLPQNISWWLNLIKIFSFLLLVVDKLISGSLLSSLWIRFTRSGNTDWAVLAVIYQAIIASADVPETIFTDL